MSLFLHPFLNTLLAMSLWWRGFTSVWVESFIFNPISTTMKIQVKFVYIIYYIWQNILRRMIIAANYSYKKRTCHILRNQCEIFNWNREMNSSFAATPRWRIQFASIKHHFYYLFRLALEIRGWNRFQRHLQTHIMPPLNVEYVLKKVN